MSVESTGGIVPGAAGSPAAQGGGSDVERAKLEAANRRRQVVAAAAAASAAGVSQADGDDLKSNERDADGRRAWEFSLGKRKAAGATPAPRPRDASEDGSCGNALDATA